MQTLVSRMMTVFSLLVLFLVAAVVVRLHSWKSETAYIHWPGIPSFYVPHESTTQAITQSDLALAFNDFKLPELKLQTPQKRIAVARKPARVPRVEFQRVNKQINILEEVFAPAGYEAEDDGQEWKQIQGSVELPKIDDFAVAAIVSENEITTNLLALADSIKLPVETQIAKVDVQLNEKLVDAQVAPVRDEIKLTQAKSVEVEPEFFEYQSEAEEASAIKKVHSNDAPGPVAYQTAEFEAPVRPVSEYSLPDDLKTQAHESVTAQNPQLKSEDEIVAFNIVSTQPKAKLPKAEIAMALKPKAKPVTTHPQTLKPEPQEEHGFVSSHEVAKVVISPLSVGRKISKLHHFELRAQDDNQTTLQDNGSGSVVIIEELADQLSSRNFVLMQKDHVATHVDIPVAAGRVDIEIPALTSEFLAKYYVQPGAKPLGYVLIELDDETDNVYLDGLRPKLVKLTDDFKVTKGEDFRYMLFTGVEVGNRLMTTKRNNGTYSYRILHVYEEEVTFDPNIYGLKEDVTIALFEEDVLSKNKRELSISSENVAMTFSGVKSTKLATNRHKLRSGALMLGARYYITLSHQKEEIFVGVDSSKSVEVPSESLMKEVIKKFGLQGNSKACVIQVNLEKPAKKYELFAESHGQSHVSYGLALDEDGQFYETLGEKSRRLFIMSENQGGDELAENAKINVRIEYQDGTKRSFSTFCSSNTYLVEQL